MQYIKIENSNKAIILLILFLKILLYSSCFLLAYTYLLYPILLKILPQKLKLNILTKKHLPQVSVLMAAFNEEKIIAKKMQSLINLDYPIHLIHLFIGSDNSTDKTNDLILQFVDKYPHRITFIPFDSRQGKPRIINKLAKKSIQQFSKNQIFLNTDANVILLPKTLKNLVRHFQNPEIGLVDTNMINKKHSNKGISNSEAKYINREVKIKNLEGIKLGRMMGPFGGCFSMRAELFKPVPDRFIVDDFYLNMLVFEKNKLAINDLEAKVYETGSEKIIDEFNRKKRISSGNFQNLFRFKKLLNPFTKTGFTFISHKVIRWFGPFLIIVIGLSLIYLSLFSAKFYQTTLYFFTFGIIGLPLVDWLFSKLNIHISVLRNIRYFMFMNLALFIGFINFLKGISTNVWNPPPR